MFQRNVALAVIKLIFACLIAIASTCAIAGGNPTGSDKDKSPTHNIAKAHSSSALPKASPSLKDVPRPDANKLKLRSKIKRSGTVGHLASASASQLLSVDTLAGLKILQKYTEINQIGIFTGDFRNLSSLRPEAAGPRDYHTVSATVDHYKVIWEEVITLLNYFSSTTPTSDTLYKVCCSFEQKCFLDHRRASHRERYTEECEFSDQTAQHLLIHYSKILAMYDLDFDRQDINPMRLMIRSVKVELQFTPDPESTMTTSEFPLYNLWQTDIDLRTVNQATVIIPSDNPDTRHRLREALHRGIFRQLYNDLFTHEQITPAILHLALANCFSLLHYTGFYSSRDGDICFGVTQLILLMFAQKPLYVVPEKLLDAPDPETLIAIFQTSSPEAEKLIPEKHSFNPLALQYIQAMGGSLKDLLDAPSKTEYLSLVEVRGNQVQIDHIDIDQTPEESETPFYAEVADSETGVFLSKDNSGTPLRTTSTHLQTIQETHSPEKTPPCDRKLESSDSGIAL